MGAKEREHILGLLEQDEGSSARDAVTQYLKDNSKDAMGWVVNAKVEIATERFHNKIIEYLEKAGELAKGSPEVHFEMARVYHSIGEPETAMEHIVQALEQDDEDPRFYLFASELLRTQAKWEDSVNASIRAGELMEKDSPEPIEEAALTHIAMGKADSALGVIEFAAKLHPDRTRTLRIKAQILGHLGRFEESLPLLEKVHEQDPEDILAIYYTARCYMELGRVDEALEFHEKQIALESKFPDLVYGRAVALQMKGRLDEALELFDQAIRMNPDQPHFHYNKATTHQMKGDMENALESLERGLKLTIDDPNIWDAHGVALASTGKPEEGLESLNRAINIQPDHPDYLYNRGVVLEMLGRPEEAARDYIQAIKCYPDHEPSIKALEAMDH